MIHKKKYITLAIIFLITFFVACNKTNRTNSKDNQAPKIGGTLRFMQDTPHSLDPVQVKNLYEGTIINQIFNRLVEIDENLNIVPGLAKYWEISGDRLIYTFTLHDNVYFHNGKNLTSKDVIYSYKRILEFSKIVPVSGIDFLKLVKGANKYLNEESAEIEGFNILNENTFQIILEKPTALLLSTFSLTNFSIIPENTINETEIFSKNPIGTGPFKLSKWIENEYIILNANDKYFKGRPYLDSIVIYIPEKFTLEEQFLKFSHGQLDVSVIPFKYLNEVKKSDEFRILQRPELSLFFLGMNVKYPPFNDANFRRAIYLGINNKEFDEKYGSSILSATTFIPPGLLGYDPTHTHKIYDLKQAKTYLNYFQAKSKSKIPKIILYTIIGNNENDIVNDLAEVGINVEVVGLPWREFEIRLDRKELPFFSLGWIADHPDPDGFLYELVHSSGTSNLFNFKNDEIDSLLEVGRREFSPNKRINIYHQVEHIMREKAFIVPLYYGVNTIAVQSYVRNFNINSLGFAKLNLDKVWIEK